MTLCPDTGYFVRECFCSQCSEIRDEISELHAAKARVWLFDEDDRAKDNRLWEIDARLKRLERRVA